MSIDTTVDQPGRVLLAQAPNGKRHWAYEGRYRDALVTHCWVTTAPWPLEYGSGAAISCARCRRAWDKEQRG